MWMGVGIIVICSYHFDVLGVVYHDTVPKGIVVSDG